MSEIATGQSNEQLKQATAIVVAYVSNNSLPRSELPSLIRNTYAAIIRLSNAPTDPTAIPQAEKPTPAQIRKSVTPNVLISFIDGNSYKTLKRHLFTHGLDASSYRQRYGLPDDYPMIASSYAKMRSDIAKSNGLGRGGTRAIAATEREAAE